MEIIISNSTKKPIYEQITQQIKSMIMAGELQAGDPLPSIRGLAKTIKVSVITVQRAFDDLQRDGFIETTVGRGSFVAQRNNDFIQEEQYRRVEEHLEAAVDIAKTSGIPVDKLAALLQLFYDESS